MNWGITVFLTRVKIGFTIILLCFNLIMNGMDHTSSLSISMDSIPAVFMIGEFSEEFEKLNSNHPSLLQVCQNDVYLAYDKWLHMLGELENTAELMGMTLKGTKYWYSVFWNQDGTIRHFAYFPKYEAKPVDQQVFKQVIAAFIINYKLPISTDSPFYNYGSGAFPLPDKKPVAKKS